LRLGDVEMRRLLVTMASSLLVACASGASPAGQSPQSSPAASTPESDQGNTATPDASTLEVCKQYLSLTGKEKPDPGITLALFLIASAAKDQAQDVGVRQAGAAMYEFIKQDMEDTAALDETLTQTDALFASGRAYTDESYPFAAFARACFEAGAF
jgi:hypothetical protein